MYIHRALEERIAQDLFKGLAIVVYGPRQSGKTTMLHHLIDTLDIPSVWFQGDVLEEAEQVKTLSLEMWKRVLGKARIIVMDEAQHIRDIGRIAKVLVDRLPDVQLILCGSSSFELANRTAEPLTGRKFEYLLLPPSFSELSYTTTLLEEQRALESRLIYGSYPRIAIDAPNAAQLIRQIEKDYLYKDLLILQKVRRPEVLGRLVRALALQIGSEVSLAELGSTCSLNKTTVERYIALLEQMFVIFQLPAFNSNERTEIKKKHKVYFYDLGIRNAVVNNFDPLASRHPSEVGHIWENYVIAERMKLHINEDVPPRSYFWRNRQQAEIDYLEQKGAAIHAFELRWQAKKGRTVNMPVPFAKLYPEATFSVVTPENYMSALLRTKQSP